MSDQPPSKPTAKPAPKPSPKPSKRPSAAPADQEADDQGMYDLADDPDDKPPPKPARAVPAAGAASGAVPGRKPGAGGSGGGPVPTGARKGVPSGARKPAAAAPKRPGRVSSAMEGGAMLAAARTGPRRNPDADRQAAFDMAKKIGLLVGAVVVLVGIIVGVKMLSGEDAPDVGDDKEAKKLISDRQLAEAREWMSKGQQGRTFVGHSPGQAEVLVTSLYDKGAKSVLAGGKLQSLHIVIELPADKSARAELVDWANQWHAKYGFFDRTGRKDEGQRFLVAQMPLNR